MTNSVDTPFRWKRALTALLVATAIFGIVGVVGWYTIRDDVALRPEYRLKAENVTVPERPDWVPEDFVVRVLRSSGLITDGSLLDDSLAQKLAQGFAADPWVEEVRRVEIRFPSGADVDLVYRRAIALVEVPSQGLFPVDRHGVLLPTEYFLELPAPKRDAMPRIQGPRTVPLGNVGTPWGDPLVQDAAKLADLLADEFEELKLARILVAIEPGGVTICRLRTHSGTEIIWGPVNEGAEGKQDRLKQWSRNYHSLDQVPEAFRPIDLQRP